MTLDLRAVPAEVLAAARAGDKAALTAIFEQAAGVIRFYARKRARLGEELGELISIGNLAVFDALRTFSPTKGHFFGWLCWWLDGRMRGRDRNKSLPTVSTDDEGGPDVADETDLPDELLALHDDTLALRRAVARLPREERIAVRHFLEGLTLSASAAQRGASRETMRLALRSGISRLELELTGKASEASPLARRSPGPAQCGTRSRYNKGCRCAPCVRANRTYSLRWERKRAA